MPFAGVRLQLRNRLVGGANFSIQMVSSTQGGSCVNIASIVIFFKSGLTIAFLESAGTFDVVRDAFIVAVISGTNSCEHCFSSHVDIGYNSHDLTGAKANNRSTSDSVTISK